MRVLLDTHALAWWVLDDPKLSSAARNVLIDGSSDVMVSVVSAFEMATKHRLGKWPDIGVFVGDFASAIAEEGFDVIDVNLEHAILAGRLPAEIRDPFDRLIAAQAILTGIPVVSADTAINTLGAKVIW